jgi:hypothetical protein
VDLTCFACFLELVGNHHVRSVYVVSNNFSPYDSAYYSSCVDSNAHVQAIECGFLLLDLIYLFEHVKGKTQHVFSLFYRISIIAIGKSKDNIAITYGINFIDIFFGTEDIKLLE